jgi:hypothetical protein
MHMRHLLFFLETINGQPGRVVDGSDETDIKEPLHLSFGCCDFFLGHFLEPLLLGLDLWVDLE